MDKLLQEIAVKGLVLVGKTLEEVAYQWEQVKELQKTEEYNALDVSTICISQRN